jgi:glycerophosphoryl diester phosphodiesterase
VGFICFFVSWKSELKIKKMSLTTTSAVNEQQQQQENEDLDLTRIVCHRGYHDPDLLDENRPIENSLPAYEKSWNHFSFCECDITSSKDGILFLCHDETYQRVSKQSPFSTRKVNELLAEEIEQIQLLDGKSKPCRLQTVLEYARKVSPAGDENNRKKMVIELKKDSGSELVLLKLKELLETNVDLALYVEVIMSFDLEMMKVMGEWKKSMMKTIEPLEKIKLMLLTEAPAHWLEANNTICQDICAEHFVSSCFKVVKANSLDGIYLEFQDEMIEIPLSIKDVKYQERLKDLSENIKVGVWTYSTQPDGLKTLSIFQKLGVSYVNSDLPDSEIMFLGLASKEHKAERDGCFDDFLLYLFCIFGR